MSGALYLIPTPINETSSLDSETKDFILEEISKGSLICVEEMKEGRRRWLRFGLPRESIEDFILYNEHTRGAEAPSIVNHLKSKNVLIMSDCGLPAFCDPGAELVSLCHNRGIRVSATPYPNSVSLALALSGFNHDKFIFEGFLPVKNPERKKELTRILSQKLTSIIMDTPYRLKSTLEDLASISPNQTICLCMDLNKKEEQVIRDTAQRINKKIAKEKREFIIVIGKSL